jgi:hypothetical protein
VTESDPYRLSANLGERFSDLARAFNKQLRQQTQCSALLGDEAHSPVHQGNRDRQLL